MNVVSSEQKTRKPKGRIDRSQQEAVTQLDAVKERVDELENLCRASASAADEFADGVKSVAEESGLLASVVRKFVLARVSEKFEERKQECEQLALLFDDIGR